MTAAAGAPNRVAGRGREGDQPQVFELRVIEELVLDVCHALCDLGALGCTSAGDEARDPHPAVQVAGTVASSQLVGKRELGNLRRFGFIGRASRGGVVDSEGQKSNGGREYGGRRRSRGFSVHWSSSLPGATSRIAFEDDNRSRTAATASGRLC